MFTYLTEASHSKQTVHLHFTISTKVKSDIFRQLGPHGTIKQILLLPARTVFKRLSRCINTSAELIRTGTARRRQGRNVKYVRRVCVCARVRALRQPTGSGKRQAVVPINYNINNEVGNSDLSSFWASLINVEVD